MTSIPNKSWQPAAQWLTAAALATVIALCWAWIAAMALDMYGPMTGCSSWMMTRHWDLTHQALLFAMWAVMMTGMMLPSAMPAIFHCASPSDHLPARAFAFAAGYLIVWVVFSLAATALQLWLTSASLLSPMMALRSRWLGAALIVIAVAYQLTPWRRRCLECCRCRTDALVTDIAPLRAGIRNGLSCLGCCWALMLLLFAGGVMNLWWLAALTIFVLLEKLIPSGRS